MTCLPSYLSGGNPGATLRALLKSLRRQPPSRRQLTVPRVRLAQPAASFAAAGAAATAGLPLRCPALAGEGSPPSPPSFPLPSPPPSRRCLGSGGRSNWSSKAGSGFRPSRVVVVAKTTRYEFEQQRYRYAGLSEEDLKQLVSVSASGGSSPRGKEMVEPRGGVGGQVWRRLSGGFSPQVSQAVGGGGESSSSIPGRPQARKAALGAFKGFTDLVLENFRERLSLVGLSLSFLWQGSWGRKKEGLYNVCTCTRCTYFKIGLI